ncbi:ATPase, T2SS/T4P/T4SS family [Kiloniella sp.]|uniref:ATPase, T2SS/T4P/T4SS family n=1 Tax=Kiloniella sp. TaxID=1938587 RepID=UPI003B014F41
MFSKLLNLSSFSGFSDSTSNEENSELAAIPGKEDPWQKASGLVSDPDLDEYFMERCCVFSDGTYWYAKGFQTDNRLLDLIANYTRKGIIPKEITYKSVGLEKIAEAYGHLTDDNKGESAFLHSLLEQCAQAKASDFIIKETEGSSRFFALINDLEYELCDPKLPKDGDNLINLMFSNRDGGSNHDGLSRHKAQGFSVSSNDIVRFPKGISKLRIERGPTFPNGQHLIARIFYSNTLKGKADLRKLGLAEEVASALEVVASSGHGLIIMAAPTGEGKSTTLATVLKWLSELHKGALRIVTVEDPPEYVIEGVTQTAVSNAAEGESRAQKFIEALKSFVRVNPATGMIGEIRDKYSAKHALAMVRTGHQIFTTIHETSANAILFRIIEEFGISPTQITNPKVISLLIRQTLTTTLCPDCCLKLEDLDQPLSQALQREIKYTPAMRFRNPAGCEACNKTSSDRGSAVVQKAWSGYCERKAIAEYIKPDRKYLELVKSLDEMAAEEYWLNSLGGKTIHTQVSQLIHQGQVDPLDARRKGIDIEAALCVVKKDTSPLRDPLPHQIKQEAPHGA